MKKSKKTPRNTTAAMPDACWNCDDDPDGWLAVGDAALSFDPLSSQGLFNALFTGLAAAEAADSFLSGNSDSFAQYHQTTQAIFHAYRTKLAATYNAEKRWPAAPFWRRRHALQAASAQAAN